MSEQIGKFRILHLLGEGGMGRVYLAEDPHIGRRVAVKIMTSTASTNRERFMAEARIVGGLSHPNIVILYDFGFEGEQPYLVMEYLEGSSLQQWMQRQHPLVEHARIMAGLCRAVGHAHRQGVLHRDIKPGNVQVLASGECKLMDFGIARASQSQSQLTTDGIILGTPLYMPPEVLMEAAYSPRADIYALGVLFYEMLTGANPFQAKTIHGCIYKVIHEQPSPLDQLRPELPAAFVETLAACMAKQPADRPADLESLGAAVDLLWQTPLLIPAPRPSDSAIPTQTLAAGQAGALPGATLPSEPKPAGPSPVTQTLASGLGAGEIPPAPAPEAAPPPPPPSPSPAAQAVSRSRWRGPLLLLFASAVLAVTVWRLAGGVGHRPEPTPASGVPTLAPSPPVPTPTLAPAPPASAPTQPAPPALPASPTPTHPVAPPTETRPPRPSPPPRSTPTSRPPTSRPPTPSTSPSPPTSPSPEPASPPPTSPPPSPTPPPPVVELEAPAPTPPPAPMLEEMSPRAVRRGDSVKLLLRGKNLHSGLRPNVLRGSSAASAVRVISSRCDPARCEIQLLVDRNAPLGAYLISLSDATGSTTNKMLLDVNL